MLSSAAPTLMSTKEAETTKLASYYLYFKCKCISFNSKTQKYMVLLTHKALCILAEL